MKPGGLLRDLVGAAVFAAAAGNIFVYTVKAYRATYHSPPLKAWQTGGGLLSGEGPGTEGKKKGGQSLPEKLLEGGGEVLKKVIPGGELIP
jgi:hypothetical protein